MGTHVHDELHRRAGHTRSTSCTSPFRSSSKSDTARCDGRRQSRFLAGASEVGGGFWVLVAFCFLIWVLVPQR